MITWVRDTFTPLAISGLILWSRIKNESRLLWNVSGFQLNNEADATTNLKAKTGGYYVASLATGDSISIPEITLGEDFTYHIRCELILSVTTSNNLIGKDGSNAHGIWQKNASSVGNWSIRINSVTYDFASIPQGDGEWVDVVITRSGTTTKMYLNGVLHDTITTSDASILIDAISKFNTAYYNGNIKDLALFNTALTASQVANLYNNPQRFVELSREYGAERIYPFMEGNGEVGYPVWDLSVNEQHGTIQSNSAPAGTNFIYNDAEVGSQQVLESRNYTQNKFPYSADFENAAWTKLRGTLTSGQSDPDGGTNAFKFQQDALETLIPVIRQAHNSEINKVYTIRVKAKKGTNRDYIQIVELVLDGTTNTTTFDISTGIVLNANPDHIASITDLGNGWYDCKISFTCTASQTVRSIDFRPAVDTTSSVPDDQGFAYFYQPQFYESTEDVLFYETGATGINNWLFIPESSTKGIDLFGNAITDQWKQGLLNFTGLDLVDNAHGGVEWGDQVDTLDVSNGRVIAVAFKFNDTGVNQYFIANENTGDGFGLYINGGGKRIVYLNEVGGVNSFLIGTINELIDGNRYKLVVTHFGTTASYYLAEINQSLPSSPTGSASVGVIGLGTVQPTLGVRPSGLTAPQSSLITTEICYDIASITHQEIQNLANYLKSLIS